MWIFGYGSLVWRPGFPHVESMVCYVKGYRRVWHQGSTDHRGTVKQPGRTVTLAPEKDAKVWGRAFKVSENNIPEVMDYLAVREKQYDKEIYIELYQHLEGKEILAVESAKTYLASSDRSANPNYLGPVPFEELAKQIAFTSGPSGPNYEYLFGLAEAMREYNIDDSELFDLEKRVRKLIDA